jgi:hypothetical protein
VSDETFDVTVRTLGPGGQSLSTSIAHVTNLPYGAERVVPTATEPNITWDTRNLPWGTYIIQASITTPIAGDPQSSNDSNSTFIELAPGDSDGDGVNDKIDNCPTVSNPDQANCDAGEPGGELGDACDTPRLRSFVPSCNIPRRRNSHRDRFRIGTYHGFGYHAWHGQSGSYYAPECLSGGFHESNGQ